MKFISRFSFLVVSLTFNAQCKSLSKQCTKDIGEGYLSSGQDISFVMFPGKKQQCITTFYENQDYRISICSDSTLGNIHMTIRNSKRQLLYDNHSNGNNSFDFKVSTTQQLIISLIVPESNLSEELNEPEQVYGCVSAVVGFRF